MDYLKTQAEHYEKKLKQKDKEIKELKKHNEWLKEKVNQLSSSRYSEMSDIAKETFGLSE